MKKFLALLVAGTMMISLVACSSSSKDSKDSDDNDEIVDVEETEDQVDVDNAEDAEPDAGQYSGMDFIGTWSQGGSKIITFNPDGTFSFNGENGVYSITEGENGNVESMQDTSSFLLDMQLESWSTSCPFLLMSASGDSMVISVYVGGSGDAETDALASEIEGGYYLQ